STKLFRENFGPLHDLFHDLEKRGLMRSKELIAALDKTPFRDMLGVFIYNNISKDELSKCCNGLEMLVSTFTKTEDGNKDLRCFSQPRETWPLIGVYS
ncbi:hypothetical protein MKX03_001733, partial [Papaver bracteatum]